MLASYALATLAGCGSSSSGDGTASASEAHALYTHCGVVSTEFDGRLWLADPPLVDDAGNPPAGWDENTTQGTFTVHADGSAVFSSGDLHARFVRAPEGARDPLDGCE